MLYYTINIIISFTVSLSFKDKEMLLKANDNIFFIRPAILILLLFYSQNMPADLTCMLGVPMYTKVLVKDEPDKLPITIQAERVIEYCHRSAQFYGNIDIIHGNITLTADKVELHQQYDDKSKPIRTITAYGNINIYNDKIQLTGQKAWANLNTQDIEIYHCDYQMVGRQGRGQADVIRQSGDNRYIILENGSFTTCLPGDDSWSILGSKIIYNYQKQVADIWNSRFKVRSIPVFYSPYIRLPIGNKRRSGFLIPNLQYKSNKTFAFSMPYYFNLAPHYDITIIPNYISKYGTNIQTKCRYLTIPGEGLVEFNWLASNNINNIYYPNNNSNYRWQLYWYHDAIIDRVWRFNIDYTTTSYYHHFNKLNQKHSNTVNSYAKQQFLLGYANNHWETILSYKKFPIFDTDLNNIYHAIPQLNITYYKNNLGPFDFKIFSQATRFTNINRGLPKAIRLHIEPTINLPLTNYWFSVNTEAKLIATYYQQSNINRSYNITNTKQHLKHSMIRVIPQFKTDGKIILKRDIEYLKGYTHTLEPRLQYLYIPYRNQNNIGIYDSNILDIDYIGLFRDRRYSGLDRILSANRLVSGITTRIYDSKLVERLNMSIGKIYYFAVPHIYNNTNTKDHYDHISSVIWTGNSYWYINNKWGIRCDIQYDSNLNNLTLGETVLEYRHNDNRIMQFNYRYTNLQYIKQRLPKAAPSEYQQGIYQMGIVGSWPIIDRWSIVGAYYHDINVNHLVDQLLCVQYNTCCWAINISYERKITDRNNYYKSSKYDKKFMFNIELRGLNKPYSLTTDKILGSSLLPYQRIL